MVFEVKFSGFYEVDEIDKSLIINNCNKFFEKHNKKLKNIEFIELRLKDYEKEGLRKKFSVNSTLSFSGTFLTSKSWDWNLIKAVDSSLKKMEREIERKFVGKIQGKNKKQAREVNRRFA